MQKLNIIYEFMNAEQISYTWVTFCNQLIKLNVLVHGFPTHNQHNYKQKLMLILLIFYLFFKKRAPLPCFFKKFAFLFIF